MIYPGPGSSGSRMRGFGTRGGQVGGGTCAKGVRNGRKNGKGKPQQVVQWKQRNVQEGIIIVDEQQLSKLIKREPIQKFYDLDPEPFATGLFASVRRCRSRDTGQQFAAKFSSRTRYGEDCSAEIHHEIALLSLCSPSSRVIGLHDVFETPKEVILVLEFAPGGDLQTIIDDNLVPFEADVVKFVRQLVEGLAYLHERKIAHLDIKPQNLVMMADFPECDVKLCDFEISRVILEGTEIREILGTPDYVAPEILHYEPITLKADMWSLGVTIYVLLTGFSPFGGETDQETFCNISRAGVDFPEELFEDVSQEAQDFISRLLVRDPGARPTAKECLRHKWLSKKIQRTTTPPSLLRQNSGLLVTKSPTRASNSEDNKTPRNITQQQKNLRKYLSKSREALFERVVQQQQQHQKNSLRKTTLLSQYHKTRRLCESQMSLVSKSRERLLMMDQHQMSPYFSRSREKLYGLRSLSKSHEVLDLCKTAAVSGGQNQEGVGLGILKTLTRATTADLSMIPLLRQRLLGHGSSTTSITSSVTTDQDLDEPIVPPSPSEQTTFMRMQSTPSSVVQSPVPPSPVEQTKYIRMPSNPNSAVQSPVSSTTIEELLENSTEETTSRTKPEPITQIPALLSPKLLKETLQNNSKFGMFSDSGNITENVTHANEVLMEMPESLREEIIESESCSEMDLTNGEIVTVITDCTSSNETLTLESYEQEKENVELQSKETEDNAEQIEENNSINYENSLNIESDDKYKRNMTEEECDTVEQKINGILGKKDNDGESSPEELEPRYTVAQLVSAFNRHQEVVTKTSLEVTMTTNDKDTKMAPIILESEKSKFPIGPNALRLFIPDIDITNEPPKRKQKRKYNLGIRYPNQSNENDDVPKETAETLKEMYHTEDEESFQSLESTSSLTGDCDSLTNLSIPEDPSFIEGENEEQNTIEEKKDDKNISKDEHLDVNADSTNNNDSKVENNGICTLIIDPPVVEKVHNTENEDGQEIENKLQLPVEVIPSYLRSGSLSSEASVASSETSSTMSWDELTPPNTGTPTSIKDESQQWPLKSSSTLNPIPKQISRSRSPSTNREPWGRLCSGTYNRALEKFNSKVNKQDNNGMSMDTNRRPNRKSLTLLSPPPVINPSEKVRRKSIPVIKQYS